MSYEKKEEKMRQPENNPSQLNKPSPLREVRNMGIKNADIYETFRNTSHNRASLQWNVFTN